MSEQHVGAPDAPLIPMPPITPAALRAAIAQIAPAHLPSFVKHLDQAVEQAAAQSTIAPLRTFLQQWGRFVAIQRFPARAARLRALEDAAAEATDREEVGRLVSGMMEIIDEADREASS
ncbi:DUF6247 family protein [Streptomyces griseocarneus]|uniref:DUF6247 family protein n=1 Tax=Streptomyces griseocarneus TaxID=51201 RepID=UPI00167D6045|nr:DUF6247 family protein [Streptomyces griseocarneus]MBZ6475550.1 DUF6247 family protein [Streptomyces griseocarneus]GHG69653.1 hypothetical protein GCM10018779_43140 [Streptomyces griseocarneus]